MATKKVRYVGRYPAVRVETAPRRFRTVQRGEVAEVESSIAESLCEQPANWQTVRNRSSSSKGRGSKSKSKSATTPPTETTEPSSSSTQEG